jgi:hypothetical protein
VGSAYGVGQPSSTASGYSSWCQGSYDGTLTLIPRPAGGLRVTVRLPVAPPGPGT